MNNVHPINDAIGINFISDSDGQYGISHNSWEINIIRNGDDVAIVNKETGELLESMNAQTFNSIIYYWLMLDSPELFGSMDDH